MRTKTYVGVLLVRFHARVKTKGEIARHAQTLVNTLPPEIEVVSWDIDQLVEIPPVPEGKLGLQLCSVGNPDLGQYSAPSNAEFLVVADLPAARDACETYQEKWDLGGGNWGKESGVVRNASGKIIARFSYNLRCWGADGNEMVMITEGDA